ncbi:PilZ domain-containing protein [Acidocella facilis]|uniref:PilZ domain-containing protein n=1 Tax=Acidocella facilis TaxID=525 RepID=UPI00054D17C5|nr:PilZ domain-containing protein [Acidocella facilis]
MSILGESQSRTDTTERRRSARQPALSRAKLVYGLTSQAVVDCMVRDLSEGGAKVETAVMMPVPDYLTLRIDGRAPRRVRRCWARGVAIGLEYLNEPAE